MSDVPTGRLTRRALLAIGVSGAGGAMLAGDALARADGGGESAGTPAASGWYVPADTTRHERTWMSWPARRDIWGSQLPGVQHDVARIARTVAKYEPVSMIARPRETRKAAAACGPSVHIVPMANDDLWMRDAGPVFLINGRGGLAGLDLNFNGWGGKQVHVNDARVARKILDLLGIERVRAPFVAEGGALETDGHGTAMATESSIVNANRNPGHSKAQITSWLRGYLGVRKVVWVPGLKGQDITDDHIDGLARFIHPGRVVVSQPADPHVSNAWARSGRQALRILSAATDAGRHKLHCVVSRESSRIPPGHDPNTFVNTYVNWYACNGAVLIPAFDDPGADTEARELVAHLYPERAVEQLRIDSIAAGGGGIHCATQEQPLA
ncbi:MAG TPA: agmatine deiminase family protein [Solirubrobacteraceae bacterium]